MSGTALHFSSTQLLTQFLQDEAYLLQCANTFDWNNLTRRCILIVEIFTTSILDRHKANHKQIKRSAIRQLTQTDNWRNTPLHLACFNRAQSSVVEALLEAAAAADVNLVEFQKHGNDTPLLIACGMGASPQCIQLLLNAGETNAATRMPDINGKTPLVELCQYYEDSRASRQRQSRRYRANDASSPALADANLFDAGSYSNLFTDFWESANHLLTSNWIQTRPGGEASFVSILHAAAAMAESCPADWLDLLLRTNAHMVSFPSRNGVLPLHLAVSNSSSKRTSIIVSEPYELQQQQRTHVITKLCSLYPQAVSHVCPFSGRTPFCQAIASGLAWNSKNKHHSAVTSYTTSEDSEVFIAADFSIAGPLQVLLQHQPEALYARDLTSHLYPFLLAASTHGRAEDDDTGVLCSQQQTARSSVQAHVRTVDDSAVLCAQQTDTVYGLLRAYPQVLNVLLISTL